MHETVSTLVTIANSLEAGSFDSNEYNDKVNKIFRKVIF
jgi:hypothetical protein